LSSNTLVNPRLKNELHSLGIWIFVRRVTMLPTTKYVFFRVNKIDWNMYLVSKFITNVYTYRLYLPGLKVPQR
jgi:hypothetical protein